MAETPEHLAERLKSDGQKSLDFFRSLSPQEWELPVYSEGTEWQIRQILAHFVSAERANKFVIVDIVNGGPGAPPGFDVDRFNASEVQSLSELSTDELFDQFESLRRSTVLFVQGLSDDDLKKEGRHPFFGNAPVEEIIKLVYRHNQIHIRDIRKVLEH